MVLAAMTLQLRRHRAVRARRLQPCRRLPRAGTTRRQVGRRGDHGKDPGLTGARSASLLAGHCQFPHRAHGHLALQARAVSLRRVRRRGRVLCHPDLAAHRAVPRLGRRLCADRRGHRGGRLACRCPGGVRRVPGRQLSHRDHRRDAARQGRHRLAVRVQRNAGSNRTVVRGFRRAVRHCRQSSSKRSSRSC